MKPVFVNLSSSPIVDDFEPAAPPLSSSSPSPLSITKPLFDDHAKRVPGDSSPPIEYDVVQNPQKTTQTIEPMKPVFVNLSSSPIVDDFEPAAPPLSSSSPSPLSITKPLFDDHAKRVPRDSSPPIEYDVVQNPQKTTREDRIKREEERIRIAIKEKKEREESERKKLIEREEQRMQQILAKEEKKKKEEKEREEFSKREEEIRIQFEKEFQEKDLKRQEEEKRIQEKREIEIERFMKEEEKRIRTKLENEFLEEELKRKKIEEKRKREKEKQEKEREREREELIAKEKERIKKEFEKEIFVEKQGREKTEKEMKEYREREDKIRAEIEREYFEKERKNQEQEEEKEREREKKQREREREKDVAMTEELKRIRREMETQILEQEEIKRKEEIKSAIAEEKRRWKQQRRQEEEDAKKKQEEAVQWIKQHSQWKLFFLEAGITEKDMEDPGKASQLRVSCEAFLNPTEVECSSAPSPLPSPPPPPPLLPTPSLISKEKHAEGNSVINLSSAIASFEFKSEGCKFVPDPKFLKEEHKNNLLSILREKMNNIRDKVELEEEGLRESNEW